MNYKKNIEVYRDMLKEICKDVKAITNLFFEKNDSFFSELYLISIIYTSYKTHQ